MPESRAERAPRGFDLAGAVLVTGGLVLLVYAIVKAQAWGWGDGRDARAGGRAAGAAARLRAMEPRRRAAGAPVVFRTRTLATANGATLLLVGGLFSMFFFGSLYFQQIKGYDALEAGLAFLPMTVGIIAGAVISQHLIARFGVKARAGRRACLVAAGLAAGHDHADAGQPYWTAFLPASCCWRSAWATRSCR